MKIITVETLKKFLDELNKKYGTEFYTKAEIDEKLKSNGGSVDFKELAERIPSWQWKVTMPKTINQTVTATVGEQTYTSDFYAPQGSNITFSAKADDGYKAGTLSLESVTLTEDIAVTVTMAVSTETLTDGNVFFPKERFETNNKFDLKFDVPPKVKVIKIDAKLKKRVRRTFVYNDMPPIYFKVTPDTKIQWRGDVVASRNAYIQYANNKKLYTEPANGIEFAADYGLSISWGVEINNHTFDYDLSE